MLITWTNLAPWLRYSSLLTFSLATLLAGCPSDSSEDGGTPPEEIPETPETPVAQASLRALHLVPGTGAAAVLLGDANTPLLDDLAFGVPSAFVALDAGQASLSVVSAADAATQLVENFDLELKEGERATAVVFHQDSEDAAALTGVIERAAPSAGTLLSLVHAAKGTGHDATLQVDIYRGETIEAEALLSESLAQGGIFELDEALTEATTLSVDIDGDGSLNTGDLQVAVPVATEAASQVLVLSSNAEGTEAAAYLVSADSSTESLTVTVID